MVRGFLGGPRVYLMKSANLSLYIKVLDIDPNVILLNERHRRASSKLFVSLKRIRQHCTEISEITAIRPLTFFFNNSSIRYAAVSICNDLLTPYVSYWHVVRFGDILQVSIMCHVCHHIESFLNLHDVLFTLNYRRRFIFIRVRARMS